jgi:hypothetical protein
LALAGCDKPSDTATQQVSATASAAPAFDVEGFCEKVMSVDRKCEGEDEFMEGNKIGLCTTTLRTARDDDGAKFDQTLADKCLADVKAAKPPLPDIRTLKTLAERFDSCRAFGKPVPSLKDAKAVPLGKLEAGEACTSTAACLHGHFCPQPSGSDKRVCTPQKKAGEPCRENQDCLGRCSRKDGSKCVSYCSSD